MRVLVTGWFTFTHGEATVGDLRAAEVVCAWLDGAGIAYDLATSKAFAGGVDWRRVPPAGYTHVVFTCGPARGEQIDALLERFSRCRRVAVDVSLPLGAQPDFDAVLERDSTGTDRPDLSIASVREPLPLVGIVRAHAEPEYGHAIALDEAHAAIDGLLAGEQVGLVELDTRVDPREAGRQTCAQVESPFARVDAVVSTRLHGLVMALKEGVPALAVDPVRGGGKVSAQARALGWPHVHGVDDLDAGSLRQTLRSCLEPDARRRAAACRDRAVPWIDRLGGDLVRALEMPASQAGAPHAG